MSAIEPLSHLIGISHVKLTLEENFLLEAELFSCICEELREAFRNHYKEFFCLMKYTNEMENGMLDSELVRLIIQDILLTEEYTIHGIAYYTDIHEDVIQELYTGQNSDPSAKVFRKIVELHRNVRKDLYLEITKKLHQNLFG